jgi:hypothetical protein
VLSNFDQALRVLELATVIAGVLMYFKDSRQWREEVTELLWKNLEQLSHITGDGEVMSGFRTRSGRYIRPRSNRLEPQRLRLTRLTLTL